MTLPSLLCPGTSKPGRRLHSDFFLPQQGLVLSLKAGVRASMSPPPPEGWGWSSGFFRFLTMWSGLAQHSLRSPVLGLKVGATMPGSLTDQSLLSTCQAWPGPSSLSVLPHTQE